MITVVVLRISSTNWGTPNYPYLDGQLRSDTSVVFFHGRMFVTKTRMRLLWRRLRISVFSGLDKNILGGGDYFLSTWKYGTPVPELVDSTVHDWPHHVLTLSASGRHVVPRIWSHSWNNMSPGVKPSKLRILRIFDALTDITELG